MPDDSLLNPQPAPGGHFNYDQYFAGLPHDPTRGYGFMNNTGGDGGSDYWQSIAPVGREAWAAMSAADQFRTQGEGGIISAGMPDYDRLRGLVGDDGSGGYTFIDPRAIDAFRAGAADPSKIVQDPVTGYWVANPRNQTPEAQARAQGGLSSQMWSLAPLVPLLGAAAGVFLGGGGAAAAGAEGGALAGMTAADITAGTAGIAEGEAVGSVLGADALGGGAAALTPEALLPNITAPALPPLADAPAFADALTSQISDLITPPGAPSGGGFDISTTPEGVLSPTLQPAPGVDIPPPNFSVNEPGLLDRFTGALTNDPLRTLAAGASLASSIRGGGRTNMPGSADRLNNVGGQLSDDATNTIRNHGAPTADQKSSIDATIEQQWKVGVEQIRQAAANSGMGSQNNMVVQDKLRSFRQKLETQRQQLYMKQAEDNMKNALAELGIFTQGQQLLINTELRQDDQAQQRAQSIAQSLSFLYSLEGGGKKG